MRLKTAWSCENRKRLHLLLVSVWWNGHTVLLQCWNVILSGLTGLIRLNDRVSRERDLLLWQGWWILATYFIMRVLHWGRGLQTEWGHGNPLGGHGQGSTAGTVGVFLFISVRCWLIHYLIHRCTHTHTHWMLHNYHITAYLPFKDYFP